MEKITGFLDALKPARKQVFRNLTVFPILAPEGEGPDYLTLTQAIENDLVQVTEVDRDGRVPELKLVNDAPVAVLVVEGEELVGARQNRIVNVSFLVPGKSGITVPVSCVEQGRWSYRSEAFSAGKNIMHASLRRRHQEGVRSSVRELHEYRAPQGAIWHDIAEKSVRMAAPSRTQAMADLYDAYENPLEDYLSKFRLMDCQVGALFAINGAVVGIECFGFQDTFARFFQKLVKSYALDAIDLFKVSGNISVPPGRAKDFMSSVAKAKGESHPTPGKGTHCSLESRTVSGTALVDAGRVLHLSAFKKTADGNPIKVDYHRPSVRTRYRFC